MCNGLYVLHSAAETSNQVINGDMRMTKIIIEKFEFFGFFEIGINIKL